MTENTNPGNFANRSKEEVKEIASKGGKTSHGGTSNKQDNAADGDIGESDGTYKPTEHGGLKQDGTPDGRVNADGQAAGHANGQSSGSSGGDYKPTEHGGLKQDGTLDGRVKGN